MSAWKFIHDVEMSYIACPGYSLDVAIDALNNYLLFEGICIEQRENDYAWRISDLRTGTHSITYGMWIEAVRALPQFRPDLFP